MSIPSNPPAPPRRRLRLARTAAALALVLGAALTLTASAPAFAQAPPPEKPTSFGGESAAPQGNPKTPEEALVRCGKRVDQLETDAVGVPYLAAGYIAFFVIPIVFLVLASKRQRRLEGEMAELRARLAKLQDDTGGRA
ncbi:MAG: hypothetical protein U1F43_35340 [Myxococcota bacterium]